MRRTLRRGVAVALITLISAAACTVGGQSGTNTRQGGTHAWDFMIYLPLTQAPGPIYQEFVDEVKQQTNGRLDITIRPQGELPYQNTEFLRAVQRGDVEMADANTGAVSGDLAIAQAFNLPFLLTTYDEFKKAAQVLDPVVVAELKAYGAESLLSFAWPPQDVWGTGKAREKLADFRGLKVRTYAPEQQVFFRELGAVPVSLTFDEVPSAINRGVVNGLMTSALSVQNAKMSEYLDWGYLLHYNVATNYIVVNTKAKNSLPADLREILEKTAAKYETRISQELLRLNDEAVNRMRSEGMVIVEGKEADRLTGIASSSWQSWAEKNEYVDTLKAVRSSLGK